MQVLVVIEGDTRDRSCITTIVGVGANWTDALEIAETEWADNGPVMFVRYGNLKEWHGMAAESQRSYTIEQHEMKT